MTAPAEDLEALIPALREVADALGSFRLEHSGRDAVRRAWRALVRDYLVPRLLDPDSAVVVAVVGGSGCGKSTLLNSLARRRISAAGPLRPTTTAPQVWSGEGLPPTLGGFPSLLAGRGLVADPPPPEGLVVVDTPPFALPGEDGRPVALGVLEAADACVFVSSGTRYADAAGWDLIEVAARRRLPTLFVLNRLPASPEIQQVLTDDFTRRLVARGVLADAGAGGVVGVSEGPILTETGGLPPEWVVGVRKELEALADPIARRQAVARVAGAGVRHLRAGLDEMRSALVDEAVAALALSDAVDAAYRRVGADLAAALHDGRLAELGSEDAAALAAVVERRAGVAASAVAAVWETSPEGARLLAGRPGLWARDPATDEEAQRRTAAWAEGLGPLAAPACGHAWWRRRRARRQAAALHRMALDPAYRPEPGTVRHGTVLVRAAREARRGLADAWEAVLAGDAARFHDLLGPLPSGAVLARLRLDGEEP